MARNDMLGLIGGLLAGMARARQARQEREFEMSRWQAQKEYEKAQQAENPYYKLASLQAEQLKKRLEQPPRGLEDELKELEEREYRKALGRGRASAKFKISVPRKTGRGGGGRGGDGAYEVAESMTTEYMSDPTMQETDPAKLAAIIEERLTQKGMKGKERYQARQRFYTNIGRLKTQGDIFDLMPRREE